MAAMMASVALLLTTISWARSETWRWQRRVLLPYRSYKDVTVLPCHVPEDSLVASFNFSIVEETVYAGFDPCRGNNVTVVLKAGGFPVVSADGSPYPARFWPHRRHQTGVEMTSRVDAATTMVVVVKHPTPGMWFPVAYVSYTTPDHDKILQQGLTSSCVTVIRSSVDVTPTPRDVTVIASTVTPSPRLTHNGRVHYYKYHVTNNACRLRVELTMDYCLGRCPLLLTMAVSPLSMPDVDAPTMDTALQQCARRQLTDGGDCRLSYDNPAGGAWHYIVVVAENNGTTMQATYSLSVTVEDDHCWWRDVGIVKKSYPSFFTYEYVLLSDDDFVNVTATLHTRMKFEVLPVTDIGGVLTLEFRLNEVSVTSAVNVSVLVCVSHLRPYTTDTCQQGKNMTRLVTLVNTTDIERVFIPYPEEGWWYITMLTYCHVSIDDDDEEACPNDTVSSVSFTVASEPCGLLTCVNNGRCHNYMSAGVVFSSCTCQQGYSGMTCEDTTMLRHDRDVLTSLLLLTLSNLFFIPVIVMSVRCQLYPEGFVYTCTMLFSILYHLCDEGFPTTTTTTTDRWNPYCVLRINLLQFCDFYSAILALWLTIVAMIDPHPTFRSFLQVSGSFGIALGIEYDRKSLLVLLVPVLAGLSLMTAYTCIRRYRRRRRRASSSTVDAKQECRHVTSSCGSRSRSYWLLQVPAGLLLVLAGFSCFSFLQTRHNYRYVHSSWHAIMALAAFILLPWRRPRRDVHHDDDGVGERGRRRPPLHDDATLPSFKLSSWLCRRLCSPQH